MSISLDLIPTILDNLTIYELVTKKNLNEIVTNKYLLRRTNRDKKWIKEFIPLAEKFAEDFQLVTPFSRQFLPHLQKRNVFVGDEHCYKAWLEFDDKTKRKCIEYYCSIYDLPQIRDWYDRELSQYLARREEPNIFCEIVTPATKLLCYGILHESVDIASSSFIRELALVWGWENGNKRKFVLEAQRKFGGAKIKSE